MLFLSSFVERLCSKLQYHIDYLHHCNFFQCNKLSWLRSFRSRCWLLMYLLKHQSTFLLEFPKKSSLLNLLFYPSPIDFHKLQCCLLGLSTMKVLRTFKHILVSLEVKILWYWYLKNHQNKSSWNHYIHWHRICVIKMLESHYNMKTELWELP